MAKIIINGNAIEVPEDITYGDLAEQYGDDSKGKIYLAKINNRYKELFKHCNSDGEVSFITEFHPEGERAYRRTAIMILQKVFHELYGTSENLRVCHRIGNGLYCEVVGEKRFDEEMLSGIKNCFLDIVKRNIKITKGKCSTYVAIEEFKRLGYYSKANLFKYRRSSTINLYDLDGVKDYFYGFMLPSTGYVDAIDFVPYMEGFVMLLKDFKTGKAAEFLRRDKLFKTQRGQEKWGESIGIKDVGELNDAITSGKIQDIILVQDAKMEGEIANLAREIASDRDRKFVLIAGPSSSGKTTFAHKLSIQLIGMGLNPYPISLDDYYKNREDCPKNPDGSYDLECLGALDVELFNDDMISLLRGKEVEIPHFNFKTGKREYIGRKLKLGKNDLLVIEGIHGLDEEMAYTLPEKHKYRIYISALTQLSIDEHNPLPTTTGRLIRRIVRDARTRNSSAAETIGMWDSVRRGEELYIFPFQESADYVFNSALIYELSVLKPYVEPLLFAVPEDAPEYQEARVILRFLNNFLAIPSECIANNALIREFIGGSIFNC